jgi:peptidoglycan LD-endopeptidase CwlK
MPKFSKTSLERLNTCCPELIAICHEVIQVYDFSVLEGYRNEERQNYYFQTGASKLRFPKSKHNGSPSMAVDLASWPIDWEDKRRFFMLAGHMFGVAAVLKYKIRWGGDWSGRHLYDQSFNDLPHFEYIGPA